ncbi:hypothetical protein [Chryseobacterium aureum]|uniref:hypothetical protein n=1 Tax=Chryseobacterium aureum TaxID=2497456 RepID=UPI000F863475|nr:hypothetical protein [Chryseobacterium aureum]
MNLEGRKSNIYFDKTGKQILEGDLLQVFHFRTRRKIYYMYQIVVIENTNEFPVMACRSIYSEKPHYRLYVVCDNEQRIYKDAKVIYERNYQNKRLKIKPIKEATELK